MAPWLLFAARLLQTDQDLIGNHGGVWRLLGLETQGRLDESLLQESPQLRESFFGGFLGI